MVHWDDLSSAERRAWQSEDLSDLTRIYQNADGAIYELAPLTQTGQWMNALMAIEPGPRTLTGLSRERLDSSETRGRIVSVDTGEALRYLGAHPIPRLLRLRVLNRGPRSWPGLDVDPEGLVALRYTFSGPQGRVMESGVTPLDADVVRGESILTPVIQGPTYSGQFQLCLDLVQRVGDELFELPIEPLETEITVLGIGSGSDEVLGRWMRAKKELHRRSQFNPETSRCARERVNS